MTDTLKLRRRRRPTAEDGIPRDLEDWFAGSTPAGFVPWTALLAGDFELLPERWARWRRKHRFAKPPAGYEWLDDPTDPRCG